jgi:hypothetical protein
MAVAKAFDELRTVKRERLVEQRAERYQTFGRRYTAKSPLAAVAKTSADASGKEADSGGDHAGAAGR